MATLIQLRSEPYWDREIVTAELAWLGDEMCRRTGRPADAAGDKGNYLHLRGAHRSQEWIKHSAYCTDRYYTAQSGLTSEQTLVIAGFDFTPGSADAMIAQCKRLMAALKAGRLEEVREFYGNVDGDQVVDGWNNLANRAATSDSSHLWHWHLSFDRRQMHNRALMERIVNIALGDDDMQTTDRVGLPTIEGNTQATAAVGDVLGYGFVRTTAALAAAKRIEATTAAILAAVKGDQDAEQIIAEIRAQAAAEADARAQERTSLVADVVAALTPLLQNGPVGQDELEAALRSVLGSLDGASPAQ